jgi:hypothetical protein
MDAGKNKSFEIEYYHTDLFHALLDEWNRKPGCREHPVLLSLLYTYCPIAAKWWASGADPIIPYDVVWDSVTEFASGATLKEAIEKRGLKDLHGHIKKYIKSVEAYRNSPTTNYRGSELSPLFRGSEIEVTARFGYEAVFDKYFGGQWRNVLRFVRTWAFMIPDWRGDCGIQPGRCEFVFESVQVALSVPRLTWRTISWPAWTWRVSTGYTRQVYVGLMVNDNIQDQLRFALVTRSPGYYKDVEEDGEKKRKLIPWEAPPYVFTLERQIGSAEPFKSYFDVEKLVASVTNISAVALKGASPPFGLLTNSKKCEHCGYRQLCFLKNNESVSPIVYEGIASDAQKFERSIV